MATIVIGLVGHLGVGKTSVAKECIRLLREKDGIFGKRVGFMDPVYAMMKALGIPEEYVDNKDLWDEPLPKSSVLCGKTVRHACQTLGSEWGCDKIGEDIWVNAMRDRIQTLKGHNWHFVIADNVRKWPEYELIREINGQLISVMPVPKGRVFQRTKISKHISETLVKDIQLRADHILFNDVSENTVTEAAGELAKIIKKSFVIAKG